MTFSDPLISQLLLDDLPRPSLSVGRRARISHQPFARCLRHHQQAFVRRLGVFQSYRGVTGEIKSCHINSPHHLYHLFFLWQVLDLFLFFLFLLLFFLFLLLLLGLQRNVIHTLAALTRNTNLTHIQHHRRHPRNHGGFRKFSNRLIRLSRADLSLTKRLQHLLCPHQGFFPFPHRLLRLRDARPRAVDCVERCLHPARIRRWNFRHVRLQHILQLATPVRRLYVVIPARVPSSHKNIRDSLLACDFQQDRLHLLTNFDHVQFEHLNVRFDGGIHHMVE
mmetsp:Transcript_26857/g.57112  ORF Transcript_26857/g.57112 Transcript_26857/m.57112 type:complete len:279 (+) Transcript_26857:767-1603(+)